MEKALWRGGFYGKGRLGKRTFEENVFLGQDFWGKKGFGVVFIDSYLLLLVDVLDVLPLIGRDVGILI